MSKAQHQSSPYESFVCVSCGEEYPQNRCSRLTTDGPVCRQCEDKRPLVKAPPSYPDGEAYVDVNALVGKLQALFEGRGVQFGQERVNGAYEPYMFVGNRKVTDPDVIRRWKEIRQLLRD